MNFLKVYQAILMLILSTLSWASGPADNPQKLISIDIEGNGSQQVLRIMYVGVKPGITRYIVQYGKYRFTDDYVSAEGDSPTFKSVTVGKNTKRKLLLVEIPQSAGCIYTIYSLRANEGFYKVFNYFSYMCGYKPKISSSGEIVIGEWQGFWMKEIKYTYQKNGDVFQVVDVDKYPVLVSGKSEKTLSGAPFGELGGTSFDVGVGEQVTVVSYWPRLQKYLVQKSTGQKGWLSEKDVDSLSDLPWAN